MKKNIKVIIPAIIIAATMTTGVFGSIGVGAAVGSTPGPEGTQNSPVIITQDKSDLNVQVFINETGIENSNTITENGKVMIPVRIVFDALGYEVGYNNSSKIITLTKGASYITFSTMSDAYTFARMAPQPLGTAPVVKEGISYVPVELLGLAGIEYKVNKNTVNIYLEEVATEISSFAKITEIDKENNKITINDNEKGIVVLNIQDIKIEYTTEDKELMVGQTLEVVYGDIMTASQPPMNTPKSLKVVEKSSIGSIISIEKDEKNGDTRVLFKDMQMGEILLNLPKDYKVEYTTEDKELKVGQMLEVVLSDAMTMSLPPMNNPKKVKVVNVQIEEKATVETKTMTTAEVKSLSKENNQVLVNDEKMGEVLLNIHDDLKVEFKNGTTDWKKEGQKLEIEYSPIMTRSIPPINNPIKITVLN